MREPRPRVLAATLLASFLLVAPTPRLATAQAGLGHLEDASLPPSGLLRLRAATAFVRYDARYSGDGSEPLGAPFTSSALGSAQIAALGSIETLVQSASASPFTLSLGRSSLDATAREEIVPLGLEYGVTDRFAIGVTVPLVRKRLAAQFLLDTTGANVGPNPARTSAAAAQMNVQLQDEFANARALLESRIAFCQDPANQSNPNCAAILANPSTAQALLQSSQTFATDIFMLYGGGGGIGAAFVPVSQSPANAAIAQRIVDFNAQYQDFLATTATLIQAIPSAAGGPAGSAEFHGFFTGDLGRDSLALRENIGVGDIEISFKALLIDRPVTETRRAGMTLAIASGVRLPTGSRQSQSDLIDMRLGEGSVIVDSRAFLDARAGRVGLLAGGQFATSVYSADTTNEATRNSRWIELQLAPRWHLSEPFAIHGAYSLRSADKFGDDQLVGAGVSFSTLSGYPRGGRPLPIEMRFTHLQSISGDAGRPKFFRDQIEVRLYFRLR